MKSRNSPSVRWLTSKVFLPASRPKPAMASTKGVAQAPRPNNVRNTVSMAPPTKPVLGRSSDRAVSTAKLSTAMPQISVARCEGGSALLRRGAGRARWVAFIRKFPLPLHG